MRDSGRIGRFVGAARALVRVQLAIAVLAVARSVWAYFIVRDLAAERDRLQAQVATLENDLHARPVIEQAGEGAAAPNAAPILIAVPIVEALPRVAEPPPPPQERPANSAGETAEPPRPQAGPDCSGADASQPRCRPGRWNRPVLQRPISRPAPAPEPQATTNGQRPAEPR